MSISKVQAQALAEDFLDDIGTSKDELQPRESFSEIILLAGELIESAQENLIADNLNASGKLSQSLVASNPEQEGNTMKVNVYMNFYGRFQNKGVKGTRSGNSLAGYSFKNEIVSQSMYDAIKEWIGRAGRSTRTVKKYKAAGSNELKNKTISQIDSVYAKARSIKMFGIKPTGFLDKAVADTEAKVKERLGAALKIDVINSIME